MKRNDLISWSLSGVATIVWLVAVLAFGLLDRVIDNWESTLTMVFGSFLAGSSPEGGGAVAFPVFTKAMGVPGPIARTFGLSIQAVGMSMAAISIYLNRRPIHLRAAAIGSASAIVGFLAAVHLFGKPDEVFWPSSIGPAWAKATFSIVLATTSFLMIRHLRAGSHDHSGLKWTRRYDLGVVVVSLAGGVLSSLTGTGANILLFLFLLVLADVDPRIALPTALTVMAAVSIVGFVLFAIIDRQLDVVVQAGRVVNVGGITTDLDASNADLLGLWIAAVPVVVWGAPLGSLVAARVKEQHLVGFVAVLAGVEVLTTFVLVHELRTEVSLMIYLAVGLLLLPTACVVCQQHRFRIFDTEPAI